MVFDRDKGLCQICIRNLYDTYGRIYNNSIEVHHIEPIVEAYDLRLDEGNLYNCILVIIRWQTGGRYRGQH